MFLVLFLKRTKATQRIEASQSKCFWFFFKKEQNPHNELNLAVRAIVVSAKQIAVHQE
jgi:hypothetical protein